MSAKQPFQHGDFSLQAMTEIDNIAVNVLLILTPEAQGDLCDKSNFYLL